MSDSASTSSAPLRIGVFDSGVGGLTVLRALLAIAPQAEFTYVGDTARLPYGSKSQATIARYAVSSSRFLVDQGAEMLVIACNTASALALDAIQEAAAPVPVLGVIETGAASARAASTSGDVLVIATAATVESHAYAAACRSLGLRGIEKACPLLVPLVEEGWIDHPVTRDVLDIYLAELQAQSAAAGLTPDTLVLGCTHYPLLRAQIERALVERNMSGIHVIDSAVATAEIVAERLRLPVPQGAFFDAKRVENGSKMRFFATDSVAKFRSLGSRFLGRPIAEVQLVDLGG